MLQFESYLAFELNRSPLTVEAYLRDITQMLQFLSSSGKEPHPADITLSDIRQWLAALSKNGCSSRTVRRKAESIRAWFRYLRKKGIIKENPASKLTLPKIPKHLPDIVRKEEMETVISTLKTAMLENPSDIDIARKHVVIELLYSLGLRRAELIALDDSDISPDGEMKITGKRSKQRIVPIPQKLMATIRNWQKLRDTEDSVQRFPVPLISCNGTRITPYKMERMVKEVLSTTSAHRKSPHILRHSFATAMLNEGADLNSVKEFLGHESLATTQIYTHVSFAEMKKAYEKAHPRSKKNSN